MKIHHHIKGLRLFSCFVESHFQWLEMSHSSTSGNQGPLTYQWLDKILHLQFLCGYWNQRIVSIGKDLQDHLVQSLCRGISTGAYLQSNEKNTHSPAPQDINNKMWEKDERTFIRIAMQWCKINTSKWVDHLHCSGHDKHMFLLAEWDLWGCLILTGLQTSCYGNVPTNQDISVFPCTALKVMSYWNMTPKITHPAG